MPPSLNLNNVPNPNVTQNRLPSAKEMAVIKKTIQTAQLQMLAAHEDVKSAQKEAENTYAIVEKQTRILEEAQSIHGFAMLALENRQKIEAQLQSEINFCKALLHPIRRLPKDVLAEIFEIVLNHRKENIPQILKTEVLDFGSTTSVWSLSSVCRRWREVCLSRPSFWGSFVLVLKDQSRDDEDYDEPEKEKDRGLQRSKSDKDPLDALEFIHRERGVKELLLAIHLPQGHVDHGGFMPLYNYVDWIGRLRRLSRQLTIAHMMLSLHNVDARARSIIPQLPSAKNVSIYGRSETNAPMYTGATSLLDNTKSLYCTRFHFNLQTIHLTPITLFLAELTIVFHFLTDWSGTFRTMLASLPVLERLSLTCVSHSDTGIPSPFGMGQGNAWTHQKLQTLILDSCLLNILVCDLRDGLEMPALNNLSVRLVHLYASDWKAFVGHTSSTTAQTTASQIKNLSFDYDQNEERDSSEVLEWHKMLAPFTNLEILKVASEYDSMVKDLVENARKAVLGSGQEDEALLLPNLQRLFTNSLSFDQEELLQARRMAVKRTEGLEELPDLLIEVEK